MFYYDVLVRSEKYRGHDPLTYTAAQQLQTGTLVELPLRQQQVLGVVLKRVPKPSFQTKAITRIFEPPPLPSSNLHLLNWLQEFYFCPVGVAVQQFLPSTVTSLPTKNPSADDSIQQVNQPPREAPLTTQQTEALHHIQAPDTYLLHGRTGSGKTRIYIELTKQALKRKTSALILSPEIGLSSQLAATFEASFGERVVVFHSGLTTKDRREAWLKILQTDWPLIVIGPRSAIFSPLKKIGLIVVDEAHDTAYKQEQAPYYHAIRVASKLSQIHKSILVLGSATPSVVDYYIASQRKKPIIKLDQLATGKTSRRQVSVVDLKDRGQFTRSLHLSEPLIQAITQSLQKQEQSLLYLNRRGTARLVLCRQCGWQALCPSCDLPLTYHGDTHMLRCHVCDYRQTAFTTCPSCGNPSPVFQSVGTKAIVDEAKRIFPRARILRFDTDNKKAERLEKHYASIIDGDVDILVGTQILAKGLDLPKLSTLGIIAADTSLYLPDYTAQERTFQLLSQTLGRIGRGHIPGHAIIQTFHPDNLTLHAAIENNWDSFYNNELQERRQFHFPPFCYLLKLTCQRTSAPSAENAASKLKQKLSSQHPNLKIEGPAPAFHEKFQTTYRWQLTIKSSHRNQLLQLISQLPSSGWSYDLDPIDLL